MRKTIAYENRRIWAVIGFGILVILAVCILYSVNKSSATNVVETTRVSQDVPSESTAALNPTETEKYDENKQLLFLIEEEKLAHDVYLKMYETYGARVFGNILESETTHQARVLGLLNSRGIADPRFSEVGVFQNAELQALYNSLLEKGLKSEKDAMEVGVIIEEKDIADISYQLSYTQAADIVATLEDLRKGSENHLRAFNKQLG